MLAKLEEEIAKQKLLRGKPLDILFNRWQDELEDNKSLRDERINIAAQAFDTEQDGYQFQQRIRDIENDYAAVLASINANKNYEPIFEELAKPKAVEEAELNENQKLDAAYEVWIQYRYSKTETPWGKMQNELGEPEWGNVEKFREWFRNKYGESALQYAETDRPLAGRNLPPLYLELLKARQVLRPYWQVKDQMVAILGEPQTEWQERSLNRRVTRIRQRMRREDSEMDKYYNLFYRQSNV